MAALVDEALTRVVGAGEGREGAGAAPGSPGSVIGGRIEPPVVFAAVDVVGAAVGTLVAVGALVGVFGPTVGGGED